MASITLEGVTKVYPDGFRAVDSLDLVVADRELVVLVGPSGCGKSTTLRMIAGLEEVTDGSLSIGNRVVNEVPAKDRDVAMVFQSYALYPHLDVRKNLAFGLERRRRYKSFWRRIVFKPYRAAARSERKGIEARVLQAAKMLGITDLFAKKPASLSGGQRQRVAVGRALVRDPEAFLFDEPLSNLDAKLRLEMRTELKALHRAMRATMVYVTHDQEEAMTLGDRIVVMKDGVVQQCAPPSEVYGAPANRFVAEFVGTPSMNFYQSRLEVQGDTLGARLGSEWLAFSAERSSVLARHAGEAVALGVRPDVLVPGDAGLAAEVELVEDLGDRRDVVYRLATGERWVGRFASDASVREGARVRLAVDPADVHVFAAKGDGDRLR